MFMYSAVLKRYLSRLGRQSRFEDKLLGIKVRCMLLRSAVLGSNSDEYVQELNIKVDSRITILLRFVLCYEDNCCFIGLR